jgi:streptogramin lyase
MTRASHIVGNDGTVWIDNGSLGFVSRIDPATGAVIDSVEIGWAIHDIALAGDELWVLSSGRAGGQLHIVSGSAIVYHQEFPGIEPTSLVIDGNTVWAHESFEGRVYRLDARARTATAVIDFGVFRYEDGGLVTGAGSVWVALASLGAIARIDAVTNELIGIVELGSYVADVAYGGGWVWAVLPDSDLLVRIHPDSAEVTARIRVLGKPTDLEVG